MLSNTIEVESYFLVLCILHVRFAGQENVPVLSPLPRKPFYKIDRRYQNRISYYMEHLFLFCFCIAEGMVFNLLSKSAQLCLISVELMVDAFVLLFQKDFTNANGKIDISIALFVVI